MNIACDGRALLGSRTGVGTWTVNIMKGLAAHPGWRVELVAHRHMSLPLELEEVGVAAVPPRFEGLPGSLWLQWLLPAELRSRRPDVFVASLAVAPRRCPIPSVLMVHDLTPRSNPRHHTVANRFCFNAYIEDSLDRAAAVVTPSIGTRNDVLRLAPAVESKMHVIPEGAAERFTHEAPSGEGKATRARFANGHRYVLYLGTLEPRKGIQDLVAAWEQLVTEDPGAPDLVVAGGSGWGMGPILTAVAESTHGDRIHLPGYVPDEAVPALLRSAELFVLPSEAEGYGLPLAEALCCGTAAVATDLPALREVAGDAVLAVPVGDRRSLAGALRRALDPRERQRLREKALERAPLLRWGKAVSEWRRLLAGVVGV